MIHGSCLCRGVRWELEGPLELMTHCHCSMCRKSHGTGFATYVAGAASGFRWLSGEELIRRFESSPSFLRPFCSRCGSVVPGDAEEGRVFMAAGNLDDDPIARPEAHIFVASKAAWDTIAGDLPRFDAYPPSWSSTTVERPKPQAPVGDGLLRGSCLCGEVAYEVSGNFRGVVKCHCSRCRKARSAAHGANLFITEPGFRWLRGEGLVEQYRVPEASRFANSFCRRCGGIVPRGSDGQDPLGVPAGSLDDDVGVIEVLHIFTGSQASWYEIADDLPQQGEGPVRRA